MSRKRDLELAERILVKLPSGSCVRKALEAAYDLGRAAQAEKNAKQSAWWGDWRNVEQWEAPAKRLRARVNRMLEGK